MPIGPRGKKQSPRKRLDQTYLLISEGLLWRQGAAVAHCRDKDTGSSSGEYSLVPLEVSIFHQDNNLQVPVLGSLRRNYQ